MNRYIVNADTVLLGGKPIFEIFHNGESVYRIADGISRGYPSIAPLIAEYPSVAPLIAEYPAFANATLSQYLVSYPDIIPILTSYEFFIPIVLEYPDLIPVLANNPTAIPYLVGEKEPDFDYPIINISSKLLQMTSWNNIGCKVYHKETYNKDTTYLFHAGTYGKTNGVYFQFDNQGKLSLVFNTAGTVIPTSVTDTFGDTNVAYEFINSSIKVYANNSQIYSTSFSRPTTGDNRIYIGGSSRHHNVCTKLYSGSTERYRLYPLISGNMFFDAITHKVVV